MIALLLPIAVSLLLLASIPSAWQAILAPVFAFGYIAASLTVIQLKEVWAWVTIAVQSVLFIFALFPSISGIVGEVQVPILLLTFTMLIATEHTFGLILEYAEQFSGSKSRPLMDYNLPALRTALNHLYRKFASDAAVFATGFLLAVTVATIGPTMPIAGMVSDPSVYAVIALLSIALLIILKEE